MLNIGKLQQTIQSITEDPTRYVPNDVVIGVLMQSNAAITQLTDRIATERARANRLQGDVDELFSKLQDGINDMAVLKSRLYVFAREREESDTLEESGPDITISPSAGYSTIISGQEGLDAFFRKTRNELDSTIAGGLRNAEND